MFKFFNSRNKVDTPKYRFIILVNGYDLFTVIAADPKKIYDNAHFIKKCFFNQKDAETAIEEYLEIERRLATRIVRYYP